MKRKIKINTTNYSILPDEDEYEVNKFAPSDTYRGLNLSSTYKGDNEIEMDYKTGKEYEIFSYKESINNHDNNDQEWTIVI